MLRKDVQLNARIVTLHKLILLGNRQGKGPPALIPLPNRLLCVLVRELEFLLEFHLEHRHVFRPQVQNGLRQERKLVGLGGVLADGLVAQRQKGLRPLLRGTRDFLKEHGKKWNPLFQPVLSERRGVFVQTDLKTEREFSESKVLRLLRKPLQNGRQRFAKVGKVEHRVEEFDVFRRLKKEVGGAVL